MRRVGQPRPRQQGAGLLTPALVVLLVVLLLSAPQCSDLSGDGVSNAPHSSPDAATTNARMDVAEAEQGRVPTTPQGAAARHMTLFFAIEFDEDVKAAIEGTMDSLRNVKEVTSISRKVAKFRWVPPQNAHLTLQYLGDVDASAVDSLCEAVEREVAGEESPPPFSLVSGQIGCFARGRAPSVIWMNIDANGTAPLRKLQKSVERGCSRAGLKFKESGNHFEPHITFCRVDVPKQHQSEDQKTALRSLAQWLSAHQTPRALPRAPNCAAEEAAPNADAALVAETHAAAASGAACEPPRTVDVVGPETLLNTLPWTQRVSHVSLMVSELVGGERRYTAIRKIALSVK